MAYEKLESWGRLTRREEDIVRPRFLSDVGPLTETDERLIAVGLGRSYGDVGLSHGDRHIGMTGLDRIIHFDTENGIIRAEAGISLSALLRIVVPRGYFLPTTPGSRFVTLGGAVANDVHGKNHHVAGTFGSSVRALGLRRTDGEELTLTPADNTGLFQATIGGLGLTGVILWVEFELTRIGSAYLDVETLAFEDTDHFLAIADASEGAFEHTVAWVDCLSTGEKLGRGIFSRANWCEDGEFDAHDDASTLRMPIDAPGIALNPLSVKAFNTAYRAAQMRKIGTSRQHYAPFFYPLDAVGQWNRMYGGRGFYQYQSVTPSSAGIEPTRKMLEVIAESGQGSFLAVLKTFGGKASPGMLSFPREGVTLALDFPNKGAKTLALFDRLDAIVAEAGGRLYPAKDARMPRWLFDRGYPEKDAFQEHRDPGIQSDFAKRILA